MAETASGPPTMRLRVREAGEIAKGIFRYALVRPDGGELPAFASGAHVSVRVPNGMIRKYSLCNDPAERGRYEIAVLREPGGRGGSVSMTGGVKAGDEIEVSEPRNDFELVRSPAGYLFIAGGIGITPILSMIRHLEATGGKFRLFYCTRSAEATAFREELGAPGLRGRVKLHHDGGDPARSLDLWPVLERPAGAHLYCCGPRGLMQAVRDMSGHWSPSAVHFEAFTESGEARPDDRPFQVRLARSGAVIDVPAGVTILQALRAAGHEAPSSCESGTCGTCRTRLVDGQADHRDLVLAEEERGDNIMLCVSRALTPLIAIDR